MAKYIFTPGGEHNINPKFFTLGSKWADIGAVEQEKVKEKISFKTEEKPDKVWATLGWRSDHPFNPQGEIAFSESGNHASESPVTLKEIGAIWDFNPLSGEEGFVKERYINFDRVIFNLPDVSYKANELPELRLTLFLGKDEGAVVYYQHSAADKYLDSDPDTEAEIEYILPQPTTEEVGTSRDRLTYFFPVIPGEVIEDPDNEGNLRIKETDHETSFIIKILTFKRHELKEKPLLQEAINTLNIKNIGANVAHSLFGEDKYRLVRYDVGQDTIKKVEAKDIDYSAKTLLLIHGTFSSIEGSYGGTFSGNQYPDQALLKALINQKIFDQIIGFDHPTITHNAKQNVAVLYAYLKGKKFKEPVSLIGTSRGALVCKLLASDRLNTFFTVDKVMTFSGANGVGYFTFGEHVVQFFKVLKKTAGPAGKLLTAFAQFSGEFFISLPGSLQMNPKDDSLKDILDMEPLSALTRYQAVAADWHRSLQPNRWKRIPALILDAVIKLILGRKNDWVVNFENQKIAPEEFSNSPLEMQALHTNVLYVKRVNADPDPHQMVINFFS